MGSTFCVAACRREGRRAQPSSLSLTHRLGDKTKVPHQTTLQTSKMQNSFLKRSLRHRVHTKSTHYSDPSSPFPRSLWSHYQRYFKSILSHMQSPDSWGEGFEDDHLEGWPSHWTPSISRVPRRKLGVLAWVVAVRWSKRDGLLTLSCPSTRTI